MPDRAADFKRGIRPLDARLEYEQNLMHLLVAVIILRAESNDIDDVRPLIPALVIALETLNLKAIRHVPDCTSPPQQADGAEGQFACKAVE